ncbi:MAG: 2-amino-4-hydroxy-6-hydroxymethyldihydropteridine diphosphokinase [Anaerolineae bacterium]|nr:2-amino-4-hydroxy-6-hydroxymethyldihydropteridine diphosphokinase [Anaerolineae bacterium]
MRDEIHIKDLLLRGIVGINKEEREKRQDILLNITLFADTSVAGRSDDISDAVNYRTLTKRVIRMVEASSFFLVERLAAEVVALCLADPRVEAARVRVEKPGALRFARSVGVEIERTREDLAAQPNRVFVSLGSNIDPVANLQAAIDQLRAHDEVKVVALSPVYETAPVGTVDQANFLNAAVLIETSLSASVLKSGVLQPIEQALVRVRTEDQNAARTIDLDIVLFNHDVLELGSRHIPDPDILRFPHVAVPLADIAPYTIHPETGQALAVIARKLTAARGFRSAGILRRDDVALG